METSVATRADTDFQTTIGTGINPRHRVWKFRRGGGEILDQHRFVAVKIQAGRMTRIAFRQQTRQGDQLVPGPGSFRGGLKFPRSGNTVTDPQVFQRGPALQRSERMVGCRGYPFAQGGGEFEYRFSAIPYHVGHPPDPQLTGIIERMNEEFAWISEKRRNPGFFPGMGVHDNGIAVNAFIKTITRKFLHQIKYVRSRFRIDPMLDRSLDEGLALLGHFLRLFLAHGPAQ